VSFRRKLSAHRFEKRFRELLSRGVSFDLALRSGGRKSW